VLVPQTNHMSVNPSLLQNQHTPSYGLGRLLFPNHIRHKCRCKFRLLQYSNIRQSRHKSWIHQCRNLVVGKLRPSHRPWIDILLGSWGELCLSLIRRRLSMLQRLPQLFRRHFHQRRQHANYHNIMLQDQSQRMFSGTGYCRDLVDRRKSRR